MIIITRRNVIECEIRRDTERQKPFCHLLLPLACPSPFLLCPPPHPHHIILFMRSIGIASDEQNMRLRLFSLVVFVFVCAEPHKNTIFYEFIRPGKWNWHVFHYSDWLKCGLAWCGEVGLSERGWPIVQCPCWPEPNAIGLLLMVENCFRSWALADIKQGRNKWIMSPSKNKSN